MSLNAKQLELLRDAFTTYSQDNQTVPVSQILKVIKQIGIFPSQQEFDEMINKLELADNDNISFEQFVVMLQNKFKKVANEDEMKAAFKIIDQDNDGFITPIDLQFAMRMLGENLTNNEIDEMIQFGEADKKTCQINYQQFVRLIQKCNASSSHSGSSSSCKASASNEPASQPFQ